MVKVICSKCGSIGYTASPYQVKCSECGGIHKVAKLAHSRSRTASTHIPTKEGDSDASISRSIK